VSAKDIEMPDLSYILKLDVLQNSLLKFYSMNLVDKQELKRIRKMFEVIDEDGDGILSYREVKDDSEKKDLDITSKQIFKILDSYKTNTVSYEEFIKAVIDRKKLKQKKNIKKCFDAIDTDRNGRLSVKEIRDMAKITTDHTKNKEFRESFFKYSEGKHYVRLIRYHTKILS
jgi:Ca2+-binding EF-hand superfamily protein